MHLLTNENMFFLISVRGRQAKKNDENRLFLNLYIEEEKKKRRKEEKKKRRKKKNTKDIV
jgi:rRNA processing protein Gar1